MGVDFTEFDRYVADFTTAAQHAQVEDFLRGFLVQMAEEVIGRTKGRTPVDTGALRDSWQLGEITGSGKEIRIGIIGNSDYASFVEWGHAGVFVPALGVTMHVGTHWTEGRFMLTVSMDEINAIMDAKFQEAFANWCKERGID